MKIKLNEVVIGSLILLLGVLVSAGIVVADTATSSVTVGNTAPTVDLVTINSGSTITLTENATTGVPITTTVSDSNGCSQITSVIVDFYRSGVTAVSCDNNAEDNNNNCYARVTCTVDGGACTGGSDTDATYTCTVPLEYYADQTQSGTYSAETWEATITVDDGTATSTGTDTEEVNQLLALDVTSSIAYGTVGVGTDTGAVNQTSTVTNTGNDAIDPEVSGTNMTSGGDSIAVANQEYSATAFSHGAGTDLSGTPTRAEIDLAQPTSGTAPVTDIVLWGLAVPGGTNPGSYTGTTTFTAILD